MLRRTVRNQNQPKRACQNPGEEKPADQRKVVLGEEGADLFRGQGNDGKGDQYCDNLQIFFRKR